MKRIIPFIVTFGIIGLILARVDRHVLWINMLATKPVPFVVALLLFIPQNFIIIYRWKEMASPFVKMGWGEAARLILASQSMNVVLPSKMGDLTKAYFLKRSGSLDLSRAVNLVVFEKMLDLASLCLLAFVGVMVTCSSRFEVEDPARFVALAAFCSAISGAVIVIVGALYFIPIRHIPFYGRMVNFLSADPKTARLGKLLAMSHEVMSLLQAKRARREWLCAISVALWILHLAQIYFFFLCLNAPIPVLPFALLMPLAIFVGLLPLSLFGMGTRDAAIIFLFAPYYPPAILAGVGFYVSLRYLVPALTGLPLLHGYLGSGGKD